MCACTSRAAPFDSATFEWNSERGFITEVALVATDGTIDTAPLIRGVESYLGRRFVREERALSADYLGKASLSLSSTGDFFRFSSEPDEEQGAEWQARGRALWTVLANVALDGERRLAPGQRQLLVGYPVRAFGDIDPSVVVDRAEKHGRRLFPGVRASPSGDLKLEVECDHPWFGSVALTRENSAGAQLSCSSCRTHPVVATYPIATVSCVACSRSWAPPRCWSALASCGR